MRLTIIIRTTPLYLIHPYTLIPRQLRVHMIIVVRCYLNADDIYHGQRLFVDSSASLTVSRSRSRPIYRLWFSGKRRKGLGWNDEVGRRIVCRTIISPKIAISVTGIFVIVVAWRQHRTNQQRYCAVLAELSSHANATSSLYTSE